MISYIDINDHWSYIVCAARAEIFKRSEPEPSESQFCQENQLASSRQILNFNESEPWLVINYEPQLANISELCTLVICDL